MWNRSKIRIAWVPSKPFSHRFISRGIIYLGKTNLNVLKFCTWKFILKCKLQCDWAQRWIFLGWFHFAAQYECIESGLYFLLFLLSTVSKMLNPIKHFHNESYNIFLNRWICSTNIDHYLNFSTAPQQNQFGLAHATSILDWKVSFSLKKCLDIILCAS